MMMVMLSLVFTLFAPKITFCNIKKSDHRHLASPNCLLAMNFRLKDERNNNKQMSQMIRV